MAKPRRKSGCDLMMKLDPKKAYNDSLDQVMAEEVWINKSMEEFMKVIFDKLQSKLNRHAPGQCYMLCS